jgi:hypothetical protein
MPRVSGCMRALLAGLVLTSLLATAALADGGTLVATPRFVPAAGPVLAGSGGVAWLTRRDDAVLDLWVAEPGRGPRRVQRFSGADGERLRGPRLVASSSAVGLELRVTDPRGRAIRALTYAGAFGEPLRRAAMLPAVAAPPGQVVWVARACESAEIRTIAPLSPAILLPEPACELRLRSPLRLRGDHLRLGISCAGFRIDCSADVVVRVGTRVIARGLARYNHSTPPYAAASLQVGEHARELLRSYRRVRVTARIERTVTRQTLAQLPAARR